MIQVSFKKATNDELQALVEKAEAVKRLMANGSFFKDTIIPMLEEDLKDLEGSLVWSPGSTDKTIEAIGLDRVWKSGIALGVGKLYALFNRIKNEGAEAEKEMGLREKKKEL